MSWIYEVGLNIYIEDESQRVTYSQFTSLDKARKFSELLLEGILPNVTAEITLKINPQE